MGSQSSQQHREHAAERGAVTVAVVTVSDTRTRKTDLNAAYLSVSVLVFLRFFRLARERGLILQIGE